MKHQRQQILQSVHVQTRHDTGCNHTEIGFQLFIFHETIYIEFEVLRTYGTGKCSETSGALS